MYPSQTSRLTINVFNPNSSGLTDVNWTDTLPDDLVVVNPANPLVSGCGSGYTLAAVPGTQTISLSGATTAGTANPANPGTCSVTVSVTSFTVGNHTNIILTTDGDVTLNGSVVNYQYDANITLLVLPMVSPTATKAFSPTPINAGETSQITVVINNPDTNVALTDVSLQDTFPAGMTLANTTTSLTGCGAGTLGTVSIGDTGFNLTGATIATGGNCRIRVNVTTTGTGTFPNVLHPADLTTFQKVTIPGNVTGTLIVKNLDITKSFSPSNFQVGGTSIATIAITNPDTLNDLNNVHFTDTLPANLTVVDVPGNITGAGCSGTVVTSVPGEITLNNGVIPAGGACTITATVTSSTAANYTNTLSCAEVTFDGGTPGCTTASGSVRVYDLNLGLSGNKSFSPVDISPGAYTTMTINITAPGDTDLTNFSLTDTLPAGVFINSTPSTSQNLCGGGTFAAAAGTSTFGFSNGTVLAGQTCRLRVRVTSSVYGPHTNTVHTNEVSNNENRNLPADISGTFTVRDISVVKDFAASIVGRNGVTTLTITLTNNYNIPLTDIAFTDDLPSDANGGIIVATPANVNNTCNGSVTALDGTSVVALSGGSILASQNCTITLDVQGTSIANPPPNTNYTNTIAIGDVTGRVNGGTVTQNWHATSDSLRVGSPDFRINKKFDPILVTGDTSSTMTITLVNTQATPVNNISFTDTLPVHMLLADPADQNVGTCGGVITPAVDRMSFNFSGGDLAGNATCKLTIKAMMDVTGNLINTIPARSVTTTQGATNLQPTSATLTNLSSVSVDKKFLTNPVSPGGVSQMSITVKKEGINIGLTGLGLTDTLLNGLTISATPAATNTCGGTLNVPAGGTLIALTGGEMPIGMDTCAITVGILTPSSGVRTGGYENCIPAGTVVTDEGYSNIFDACDTLGSLFDPPTGYKTLNAVLLPELEWKMVWINDHNSAAINVHIRDTIPTGTTYVDPSIVCTVNGTSRTDICEYDAPNNQIHWAGDIGEDRGATNEATANNEVVIIFRVTVPNTLNLVNNQATSTTDTNDDGDFADETTTNSISDTNIATWNRFGNPTGGGGGGGGEPTLLPNSGFAPGLVTRLSNQPVNFYNEYSGFSLEIPGLGIKSNIVGLSAKNKQWDVTWLGDRLGYLEESAFPTLQGNSVITGHVYDANGKPGPFINLHTLKYGDKIIVRAFGEDAIYEVREVLTVAPTDIKAAMKHQKESWITLLTCKGYDEDSGNYGSRVLVRAVLTVVD